MEHRVWLVVLVLIRDSKMTNRIFLIALLLAAGLSFGQGSPGAGLGEPELKRIEVSARRFKFRPSKIAVDYGTTVILELSSKDVRHGFKIPGKGIDVTIPPRRRGTVEVRFTADERGKFPFRCSHVCGAGHSSMRGVIVVE